jgi:hypothetical protein
MLVAILSFSSVESFAEFVRQGLKPRGLKLFFAAVETAAYNDGMKAAVFHTQKCLWLPRDVLDHAEPDE